MPLLFNLNNSPSHVDIALDLEACYLGYRTYGPSHRIKGFKDHNQDLRPSGLKISAKNCKSGGKSEVVGVAFYKFWTNLANFFWFGHRSCLYKKERILSMFVNGEKVQIKVVFHFSQAGEIL